VSTDETENRSGMERRATDDDRARIHAEEEHHARNEEGTRSMPAETTSEYAAHEHPVYGGGSAAYAEEHRVVPGSARGRMHVGINWGAAFFGWIAAMGLAVILTAFVAAVGAAVGVTQGVTTVEQASSQIQGQDPQTVGLVGVILLAVVAFVSYYGGGYVAARMSRFDGPRQGFAVWLWAIVVAVVVAIVAAVAGARFDVLSTLNAFPRLPVNQGDLTATGILALLLLLAITLVGAVLGGAAGMRYHRKLESAEVEYLQ
jgi:amino acid transporter